MEYFSRNLQNPTPEFERTDKEIQYNFYDVLRQMVIEHIQQNITKIIQTIILLQIENARKNRQINLENMASENLFNKLNQV